MKIQSLEELEKKLSRKTEKRSKKNRAKMKVSGAGVKKLQAIIIKNKGY
jgi:hypothetical protein